jgi:hypothetical protein
MLHSVNIKFSANRYRKRKPLILNFKDERDELKMRQVQIQSRNLEVDEKTWGRLPFAKMSAQIAAIYVCICMLCAESAQNFRENFLNWMHMHAYICSKIANMKVIFHTIILFVCFKLTCYKICIKTVLRNNVISWNFALNDATYFQFKYAYSFWFMWQHSHITQRTVLCKISTEYAEMFANGN